MRGGLLSCGVLGESYIARGVSSHADACTLETVLTGTAQSRKMEQNKVGHTPGFSWHSSDGIDGA